jgi:hypothetical protein
MASGIVLMGSICPYELASTVTGRPADDLEIHPAELSDRAIAVRRENL